MKLSIKEYMQTRNVSRRTVYNRIEKNQLSAIKEGKKVYIIEENITRNLSNIHNKKSIENIENTLKTFDYNFIKSRLSSIESGLLNTYNKIDILVQQNNNKILNDIKNNVDNLENSIDSLTKALNNKIDENKKSIDIHLDNLSNEIIKLNEKQNNLIKIMEDLYDKSEKKKKFNVFK